MSEDVTGEARAAAPPILVTGTHRSGTTWIGEMLAYSPEIHYIHEPFAPMYERSWLREPPGAEYYREEPTVTGRYAADLERIASLRPPWATMARRSPRPGNLVRLAQEAARVSVARRRGARALMKDPFALLNAEWIAATSGASVIVLVRHPAAFVSSIKRLKWRLDVSCLLEQEELMDTDLAPFRSELERDHRKELDLVDHAALVWRVLNTVCWRYQQQHPDWHVIRYEAVANDPVGMIRCLYDALGASWTARTAQVIEEHNSPEHATGAPTGQRGGTHRNSRAEMWTWLDRLTADEISRVHRATEDVAIRWYSDADWAPH